MLDNGRMLAAENAPAILTMVLNPVTGWLGKNEKIQERKTLATRTAGQSADYYQLESKTRN